MTRCECQGGLQPSCDACLRRAREWRCSAYLRHRYGLHLPCSVIEENGGAWAMLDGGRIVTARVDIDRDRVVEVQS